MCPMTSDRMLFGLQIDHCLRVVIANLDSGTFGISRENLWQLAAPHISRLSHAPSGVNSVYTAREIFDDVVAGPKYRNFVY